MFNEPGFFHALLLAAVVGVLYALRKRLPGTQLGSRVDQLESPQERQRRRHLIALECTELALAGVFLLVGGAKLIGRPDMVELFRSIGFGQWLRYVTGILEVAGAAFMVIPLASGASAVTLGTVMVSATLIELFVLRRPPIAALACLSGHTYVAWARLLHRSGSAEPIAAPVIDPPIGPAIEPAPEPAMEQMSEDPPSEAFEYVVSSDGIGPSDDTAPTEIPEIP
jgi:putative oxidoreductase